MMFADESRMDSEAEYPVLPEDLLTARRALIEERCTDAKVLLIRAQHDAMKAHIRHALDELANAERLLSETPTPTAPDVLVRIVDATIDSATLRLKMVETALSVHGPDANEI